MSAVPKFYEAAVLDNSDAFIGPPSPFDKELVAEMIRYVTHSPEREEQIENFISELENPYLSLAFGELEGFLEYAYEAGIDPLEALDSLDNEALGELTQGCRILKAYLLPDCVNLDNAPSLV